jgi:hypothetical protein
MGQAGELAQDLGAPRDEGSASCGEFFDELITDLNDGGEKAPLCSKASTSSCWVARDLKASATRPNRPFESLFRRSFLAGVKLTAVASPRKHQQIGYRCE